MANFLLQRSAKSRASIPQIRFSVRQVLLSLLAVVILAPQWLGFHGQFVPSALAQSGSGAPVDIAEFNGGVIIEWSLPPDLMPISDSENQFSLFVEEGWETDLLDEIVLPAYTATFWEDALGEEEERLGSDEIVAIVDVLASTPVTISVEAKTMPPLNGPSGDQMPFLSPLESPELLLPTEPVYILREGMQRGQRHFVIAISPIYDDGAGVQMATSGVATLVGISSEQNKEDADAIQPVESDIDAAQRNSEAVNVVTEPQGDDSRTELSPSPTSATPEFSTQPTSPLASPLAIPQVAPLNSPLDRVTENSLDQTTDEEEPFLPEAPQQEIQPEIQTDSPITETAQPTERLIEPSTPEQRPQQAPTTPWSGLMTFAFLGLALVYLLVSQA